MKKGILIHSFYRYIWSPDGNNTYSFNFDTNATGTYHVTVESSQSVSRCSFIFIK